MTISERFQPILSLTLIPVICLAMMVPTIGCTSPSTTQVVTDINEVLVGVSSVLTAVDPNAAWVPQVTAAVAALEKSEAGWQAGTTTSIVLVNSLTSLEAVLAVIPETAAYSPLIDVAIAGIEAVLPLLPVSVASNRVSLTSNPVAVQRLENASKIRVKIHPRFYESSAVPSFKRVWNKTVSANNLPSKYNL